jgi:ribose transport system permease protein
VIPISLFVIAFILILSKILSRSKMGMWIRVCGKNEISAYFSAIPVGLVKCTALTFAGFCGAVGGLSMTLGAGTGDPRLGITLSMTSIAACVIGGINLAGGVGDTWGAVFGVFFLQLVSAAVLSLGINPFYQDFFSSLVLILGLFGAVILANKAEKSRNVVKRSQSDENEGGRLQ